MLVSKVMIAPSTMTVSLLERAAKSRRRAKEEKEIKAPVVAPPAKEEMTTRWSNEENLHQVNWIGAPVFPIRQVTARREKNAISGTLDSAGS